MTDKPCPRCTGQAITWFTADNFKYCTQHMGEVFRELWADEKRKIRMKHRNSA